ncbi:hypothetical protein PG984_016214 [Apiospora sp. TS-2023a]
MGLPLKEEFDAPGNPPGQLNNQNVATAHLSAALCRLLFQLLHEVALDCHGPSRLPKSFRWEPPKGVADCSAVRADCRNRPSAGRAIFLLIHLDEVSCKLSRKPSGPATGEKAMPSGDISKATECKKGIRIKSERLLTRNAQNLPNIHLPQRLAARIGELGAKEIEDLVLPVVRGRFQLGGQRRGDIVHLLVLDHSIAEVLSGNGGILLVG